MWIIIILLVLAATFGSMLYLSSGVRRLGIIDRYVSNYKVSRCASLLFVLAVFLILSVTIGFMNSMVCMIHAVIFWLICDGMAALIEKRKGKSSKKYYAGIYAVLLTIVYLVIGVFFAHHVFRTEYIIETQKDISKPLKIVMFSDSHVGATFDWKGFSEYVDKMNSEEPDAVIIAGDFVDDDTSREDMEKSCEALGNLKTAYGVYYAFGNHDAGYNSEERRGYGKDELISELEKNGVVVLQDETVNLTGNIFLCGREDKMTKDRIDMDTLMMGIDNEDYFIVIDHEPGDYEAQYKAGADLVLSGHTHGGQLIPINRVGELIGVNDMTYGHKRIENTDFIVSSGIGDWALDFKTGCISEYVVINIE